MVNDNLLPFDGQADKQQIHLYQQKVGSANYAAVVTRPDIARTIQKLSEFLVNPGPDYLKDSLQGRYCHGVKISNTG
jgi:hypothetical protein